MITKLQTYQHWVLGVVLMCYMLGSFSKSTVELIHLISHIPDILFAQEEFHSFETHSQDTHQHNALEKISDITDNNEESPIVPNHNDFKKKVEINEVKSLDAIINLKVKLTYPTYTFSVIENFKLIPNPPPWFHIF